MKELSLHILDIANNSVRGKASQINITIKELIDDNEFMFTISDNGLGIPKRLLDSIKDPFTTSRVFRKVGLGIPLLNDTCLLCEGYLTIESEEGKGTNVIASMTYNHIDRPPLGDIVSTMTTLITSNQLINITYYHLYNHNLFEFSTKEIVDVLGDVPLTNIAVIQWLKEYLKENIDDITQ